MDTQWPRFEVFKQDTTNESYQNVGTVHAPDAEMALLNARDVYSRRPSCHALWVAPERAFLKVTAAELATPEIQQKLAAARNLADGKKQSYRIFRKLGQKRSMTFVDFIGEVEAVSAEQALAIALEQFRPDTGWVWWAAPTTAFLSSEPGVENSWFEPAKDKVYRQQSYYGRVKRKRLDERMQIAQQMSQPQN